MEQAPSRLRDTFAVLVVLAALALPFLPLPGDGLARMKVDFRTPGAQKPQLVSTNTSWSICTVMAATLSYENPKTGAFTRVSCRD